MVAAESVWSAPLEEADPENQNPALEMSEPPATLSLSVREIRDIVRSRSLSPDFIADMSKDPRATVRHMAIRLMTRGGDPASNEDIFRSRGVSVIAGADEAGRGALAGPVVAAAVVFPRDMVIEGIRDSKALVSGQREELFARITEAASGVFVSFVDAALIDRWGIQAANRKALGDAVSGVVDCCQCVICDHFTLTGLRVPCYGISHADSAFQSVAAAGIVAKVERDRLMSSLHRHFPRYNFGNNKGYGTEEHLSALAAFGPSRVHRLTFRGVRPPSGGGQLWEE